MTYDRLRGYRPTADKLPKDDSTEEKERNRVGQQGFADIESLFSKLIKNFQKVTGYEPAANDLTLGTLDTASSALNKSIVGIVPNIGVKVRERLALYADLADKPVKIKSGVSAHYGTKRPEYGAIENLRF